MRDKFRTEAAGAGSPCERAGAGSATRPRGHLIAPDAITRKTVAQLDRKDALNPDYENGGMSHDMGSMSGMDHSQMKRMDHSKMQGTDMSKKPPGAATPTGEMDHSQMPGMTMPPPAAAVSPASTGAAEMEMKKTSDEMKAKSDAEKSSTKPPAKGAYWTCVMHPEIHEEKPGQCPKCGMTLVKKEGAPK